MQINESAMTSVVGCMAIRRSQTLATTTAAAAAMQLRRVQTRSSAAAASASSAEPDARSRSRKSDDVPGSAATKPTKAATKRRSPKTAAASPASLDDGIAPQPSKKAKTPRASSAKKASKSTVMPIIAAATSASDSDEPKIVYTYEHLVPGRLIRRYKRFLADVELVEAVDDPLNAVHDAEPVNPANVVTVHCPNTGPMVGLLDLPHARVQLSKSADPKRKYAYTLEMIQVDVRSYLSPARLC